MRNQGFAICKLYKRNSLDGCSILSFLRGAISSIGIGVLLFAVLAACINIPEIPNINGNAVTLTMLAMLAMLAMITVVIKLA